ncbi:MAG: hypothetical protein ACI35P_06535 [Bacillus sp. (in: firmicutes)]
MDVNNTIKAINIVTESILTLSNRVSTKEGSVFQSNGIMYEVLGQSKDGLLEVQKIN